MEYLHSSGRSICRILIFATAVLLTSCVAPQAVTKLVPEAPEGYFEHGREYITLTNDSIYAILGFDGIYSETLIFDLVVINNSESPLTLSPSNFYYEILDSAMAQESQLPRVSALSADTIACKYDESMEKLRSMQNASTFISILKATAGIVYNTSGFLATDNPGFLFDMFGSTFNEAEYLLTSNKNFKEATALLSDEKSIIHQASLKNMSLNKGESVSGYVFFPQNKEASYYMFCIPVEDKIFQFVYNQKVTYQ